MAHGMARNIYVDVLQKIESVLRTEMRKKILNLEYNVDNDLFEGRVNECSPSQPGMGFENLNMIMNVLKRNQL